MKQSKSNNLGKKYLVESCQSINIVDYLRSVRSRLKEVTIKSDIESDGYKIDLLTSGMHFNGLRYWFKCPLCGNRAGKLYKHPVSQILGCRACLNLEYKCRRYKGMIEANA